MKAHKKIAVEKAMQTRTEALERALETLEVICIYFYEKEAYGEQLTIEEKSIWNRASDEIKSIKAALSHPPVDTEGSPNDLRAAGWSVAVHNDYRLNGEAFTFWLMTKGLVCLKGEGRTDAEALNEIRMALQAREDHPPQSNPEAKP